MAANRVTVPRCQLNLRGLVGPPVSRVNSIPRFADTKGKAIADSEFLIDDDGNLGSNCKNLGSLSAPFDNLYLNGVVDEFYEEGTFTPGLTCLVNPGSLTVTFTVQTGLYIRVGNLVYINIRMTIDTIDTAVGTASGDAFITGLPFVSAERSVLHTDMGGVDAPGTTTVTVVANALQDDDQLVIDFVRDNAGTLRLQIGGILATNELNVSGIYVAS